MKSLFKKAKSRCKTAKEIKDWLKERGVTFTNKEIKKRLDNEEFKR